MIFELIKHNTCNITGFVDVQFRFMIKQDAPWHTVNLNLGNPVEVERRLHSEKKSVILARLSYWEQQIIFLHATPGYYNTPLKKECFEKLHKNLLYMLEKQRELPLDKICRMVSQLETPCVKLLPSGNDHRHNSLNADLREIILFARHELGLLGNTNPLQNAA